MPFAAAMSEHPLTAHAVGEVTGAVLERCGERPDFATVFVTPPHAGALEDVMRTVDAVLHPLVMFGCAAESVLGPHREVEQDGAISLWAGHVGPLVPLSLDAVPSESGEGLVLRGWPSRIPFTPEALVLVGDPYSFPAEAFLHWVDAHHPGLRVVGGMASAARGPGGNRLALGTEVRTGGAVGALLGPGAEVTTLVSQGCRPFGDPVVVTRAEHNMLYELAGRPALEQVVAQARDSLSEEEMVLLETGGLHLGRVIDEHKEDFGRGDFLVRNVMGADRASGAIAVGEAMAVGTTVQFHLRDAATADEDLHALVHAEQADAALVFTCNGRGTRLFGEPHHDVRVLTEHLGPIPMAGFFAAGELGPVGGHNFLHGFTASVMLLRDRSSHGPIHDRGGSDTVPGGSDRGPEAE
jgi:small ligand-binding sensory domain FIST